MWSRVRKLIARIIKQVCPYLFQVLIETLRVPAVMLQNQAVLSALSANRKVAVVVSSGHGVTEIVPVYEGYQIQHATQIVS